MSYSSPDTYEEHDRIPPDHPAYAVVWVDEGRMSGEPCFRNTRVPIQTLFDHLGDPGGLEIFLSDFPNVSRDQAIGAIALAASGLVNGLRAA